MWVIWLKMKFLVHPRFTLALPLLAALNRAKYGTRTRAAK